jgi:glycosyltransferase involved in cell wall biosynthesis
MGELKLSILMPVRNEGVNIKIMLKILKAVVEVPHEVLIVHDDPADDAVPTVKALQAQYPDARLVHNTIGKGVLNAIRSGVAASRGEYILLFAVDEVGPVLAIEDMIALMDEGCDLVSCTRYAYGGRRLGGSPVGGMLSRAANSLFHALSGASFTDGTTGIKMFKKELFDRLALESRPVGWAVVFEMAVKAQMALARFGEVPIVSIDRLYGGKSTFSLGPWFKEYLRWFFWGIKNLRSCRGIKPATVRIPKNITR